MEVQPREIRNYLTDDGKCPFSEWFDSLPDIKLELKLEQGLTE